MVNYISHREATIQSFRRDPELAKLYLESVIADGDIDEIRRAEEWVSEALSECPAAAIA